VPKEQRKRFLYTLAEYLSEAGALIVVESLKGGEHTAKPGRDYGRLMLDAIAAHGLAVPEDRDAFMLRANTVRRDRDGRVSDGALVAGELVPALKEAGLTDAANIYRSDIIPLPSGEQRGFEIAMARRS
jgi:hypothetical protein